jgi:hypothetical protein
VNAIRALARWLIAEIAHLPWLVGIRGYCWPCDELRWAWTHRQRGRRDAEAGAAVRRVVQQMTDEGRWPPGT